MFGADNALDTFWGYSRGCFPLGHDFFFDFHASHFVSLQVRDVAGAAPVVLHFGSRELSRLKGDFKEFIFPDRTAWSRSCGSAVSVHPRQQTPLPENSSLTTTAGLQSHLVTISTFTVRLRIMKIWRQHSLGVNIVRSQKPDITVRIPCHVPVTRQIRNRATLARCYRHDVTPVLVSYAMPVAHVKLCFSFTLVICQLPAELVSRPALL